jgi:alpha-tubulin suppressor-like RCC1 family protein
MITARTRTRAAVAGVAAAAALVLGIGVTAADYTDRTHAVAELTTETWAAVQPELVWTSSTSAFIAEGKVFIGGYRGNGASGTGVATVNANLPPTQVDLPVAAVKVVGGTNDFHYGQAASTTWFAALGTDGVVYQWGSNYASSISGTSNRPRAVTTYSPSGSTTATHQLPPIVDLTSSENQIFALDADGTMYVWGYAGENLPNPVGGGTARSVPMPANITVDQATGMNNVGVVSGGQIVPGTSNGARSVTWHRVYGGQNSSFGVTREGLVYVWGWDSHAGVATEASAINVRAPRDARGVNALLFEKFPETYHAADGTTLQAGDPAYWTTYNAIYQDMKGREVCTADYDITRPYDDSGCPVRQMNTGARTYRVLLANHEMYTWAASTANYGWPTIGRYVASTATSAGGYVPALIQTSQNGPTLSVHHFSAGTSAVQAVTTDGQVYGWGANNYCQAIGIHSTSGYADPDRNNGNCAQQGSSATTGLRPSGGVWYATRVWNLPDDADIEHLGGTACTTWMTDEDGTMYAFGGNTVVGSDFRACVNQTSHGYRIYDFNGATLESPFGTALTATATATRVVFGS